MAIKGMVIPLAVRDENGKFRVDEHGRPKWFPFIRTMEDGATFKILPREIGTEGLVALRFGQRVKFTPGKNGFARDITRIVRGERPTWRKLFDNPVAHGYRSGEVISGPRRGDVLIELERGATTKVVRGTTRIERRDGEDIVGFVEGDFVEVKLAPDGVTVERLFFSETEADDR